MITNNMLKQGSSLASRKSLIFRKSQTATEYLIILAVVIVIALIVIGVLGGIPSIGGGVSKSTHLAQLGSKPVGVTNYAFQGGHAKFKIKNNVPNSIKVNSLWVDQIPCGSYDPMFPFQLKVGESKTITCWNINSNSEDFNDLVMEYVDLETNSVYNTAEGKSVEEFKGISLTDCGDADADSDGYDDICTCNDLNAVRNDLTKDYELLHNIDFFDSSCSSYREGAGWTPLGTYSKSINGNNQTISGLKISDTSTNYVGLFSTIDSSGDAADLSLVNVDITGGETVGGLSGYISNDVSRIFVIGKISGSSKVGGVAGVLDTDSISRSYAVGKISGTSEVGGIVGHIVMTGTLDKNFFIGEISGSSDEGSIFGSMNGFSLTYSNNYWYNSTINPDSCFGRTYNTGDDPSSCPVCTKPDCSDRYDELGWTP